eukprot:TRINITY_DN102225_c0_g1_i1.p2 TRINITY_DN102225_c0_g1~~TRINITY_DN102225_c0_g1_i1.p2  ORF type:complete len:127 (+),score=12.18 TRINITY_DN102225_c0_g1_i1:119-499(+)
MLASNTYVCSYCVLKPLGICRRSFAPCDHSFFQAFQLSGSTRCVFLLEGACHRKTLPSDRFTPSKFTQSFARLDKGLPVVHFTSLHVTSLRHRTVKIAVYWESIAWLTSASAAAFQNSSMHAPINI